MYGNNLGLLQAIDRENDQAIINDKVFFLTDQTVYAAKDMRPLSSNDFNPGSWVIYKVDLEEREIAYLMHTDLKQKSDEGTESQSPQPQSPADGEIRLKDGVYTN